MKQSLKLKFLSIIFWITLLISLCYLPICQSIDLILSNLIYLSTFLCALYVSVVYLRFYKPEFCLNKVNNDTINEYDDDDDDDDDDSCEELRL